MLRFLVGNKCDKVDQRQVSVEQGKEMAKQYGIPFFETSAKETIMIDEMFLNITNNLIEKQSNSHVKKKTMTGDKATRTTTSIINIDRLPEAKIKKKNNKKGCC